MRAWPRSSSLRADAVPECVTVTRQGAGTAACERGGDTARPAPWSPRPSPSQAAVTVGAQGSATPTRPGVPTVPSSRSQGATPAPRPPRGGGAGHTGAARPPHSPRRPSGDLHTEGFGEERSAEPTLVRLQQAGHGCQDQQEPNPGHGEGRSSAPRAGRRVLEERRPSPVGVASGGCRGDARAAQVTQSSEGRALSLEDRLGPAHVCARMQHACTRVCTCRCAQMRMRIMCAHACPHVCTSCVCVCMGLCACMCARVHKHTFMFAHMSVHTCACLCSCVCVPACTAVHVYACVHVCAYPCAAPGFACPCVCTCLHACTPLCVYICASCTRVHASTHVYVQACALPVYTRAGVCPRACGRPVLTKHPPRGVGTLSAPGLGTFLAPGTPEPGSTWHRSTRKRPDDKAVEGSVIRRMKSTQAEFPEGTELR